MLIDDCVLLVMVVVILLTRCHPSLMLFLTVCDFMSIMIVSGGRSGVCCVTL